MIMNLFSKLIKKLTPKASTDNTFPVNFPHYTYHDPLDDIDEEDLANANWEEVDLGVLTA